MSFQLCSDTSELIELCECLGFFLIPLRKIKICVQLPVLKTPGQIISSREVMENVKKIIKPDEFTTLKVSKTHQQIIQLEGEVEKKITMTRVLQKLQGNTMKLNDFPDVLKIRAASAKLNFPTRHDWDTYFRDAKHIDEMRPGERPDTIYFENLPSKWFIEKGVATENPSEYMLKKVFETFGEIRALEIPSIHKLCAENEPFKKISAFDQQFVFEAYIQYKEYMGFVRAMDSLKGMKLVYVNADGKAYASSIKVDFDKSKYLSEKAIRLRSYQKLELEGSSVKKLTSENKETNKSRKHHTTHESSLPSKIFAKTSTLKKSVLPKAKYIREKEASLLLKELLNRAKVTDVEKQTRIAEERIIQEKELQEKLQKHVVEETKRQKAEKARQKKKILEEQERLLREKLLNNLKQQKQRKTEELREKLRKEIAGKKILKSVLAYSQPIQINKCRSKPMWFDKYRNKPIQTNKTEVFNKPRFKRNYSHKYKYE